MRIRAYSGFLFMAAIGGYQAEYITGMDSGSAWRWYRMLAIGRPPGIQVNHSYEKQRGVRTLCRRPYIQWDVTEEDRRIAGEVIHPLGLDGYLLRNVSELSGGKAQKVMLARLLLDEPTSNLNPRNQHEVLQAVHAIVRQNRLSVAIVIHDLNLAARYCDRFLFLKGSRVHAYGGMETMTPEIIEEAFQSMVK